MWNERFEIQQRMMLLSSVFYPQGWSGMLPINGFRNALLHIVVELFENEAWVDVRQEPVCGRGEAVTAHELTSHSHSVEEHFCTEKQRHAAVSNITSGPVGTGKKLPSVWDFEQIRTLKMAKKRTRWLKLVRLPPLDEEAMVELSASVQPGEQVTSVDLLDLLVERSSRANLCRLM